MTTLKEIWGKLSGSKDYRKEYVSALLKRGTAMQIQALMKQRGWTQTKLAEMAGLKQGVISRASNPEYGNLTFNTVIDIASGFDVAFVGRFVPFSEFARYVKKMPDELSFSMHAFDEDREPVEELDRAVNAKNVIFIPEKPKSAKNEFPPAQTEKKDPQSEKKAPRSENEISNNRNTFFLQQEGGLADAARAGSSR
jgi:Predicted transcriptional regulators